MAKSLISHDFYCSEPERVIEFILLY